MVDTSLIEAINAGGNLGIMAMGLYLMRLSNRVNRLEVVEQLRKERTAQHGN